MDLKELLDVFGPFILIALVLLPSLKKKAKSVKKRVRPTKPGKPSFTPVSPYIQPEYIYDSSPETEILTDVEIIDVETPQAFVSPMEEGVRATDDPQPVEPIVNKKDNSRRRELRRAYLLGEILQRKQY